LSTVKSSTTREKLTGTRRGRRHVDLLMPG
jgi:hypothetical protein